jgi:hypothetical protein
LRSVEAILALGIACVEESESRRWWLWNGIVLCGNTDGEGCERKKSLEAHV